MAAGRVLQIKRGLHSTLGTLNAGELFFETDTHKVVVGDGAANHNLVLESGATFTGAVVPTDHGTATNPEVVAAVYGTGDPPTASTTPIGTLYIKYTA